MAEGGSLCDLLEELAGLRLSVSALRRRVEELELALLAKETAAESVEEAPAPIFHANEEDV